MRKVLRPYDRSGWDAHRPAANRWAYSGRWSEVRLLVLQRDHYACQLAIPGLCIGRASQVDHVIQPEAGGTNDPSNLRSVCRPCHARRTGQQGARAQQRRRKEQR
jgi:5-methylcytosine-specific restriction protein A